SPYSIRPWQHVLELLSGYLTLAEKLYGEGMEFAEAWNFGPNDSDARLVEWIVQRLCEMVSASAGYEIDTNPQPHEATYLKLEISKAKHRLDWQPRWDLKTALSKIVEWEQGSQVNRSPLQVAEAQIGDYGTPSI